LVLEVTFFNFFTGKFATPCIIGILGYERFKPKAVALAASFRTKKIHHRQLQLL